MNFIAFYWTLPVKWAGFTQLPKTADEAAKASRTIRYQVERVRRWVKDEKGTLLKEAVFMDTRPDRGTDAIQSEIAKVLAEAKKNAAELVLVDFAQAYGWRPHGPLYDMISNAKTCTLLPPDPVMIDGKTWDIVTHFRQWRDEDFAHQLSKDSIKCAAIAAIADLRAEGASFAAAAAELNAMGYKTVNGRDWTADNVRKTMAQG